jgi:hypothetical protein
MGLVCLDLVHVHSDSESGSGSDDEQEAPTAATKRPHRRRACSEGTRQPQRRRRGRSRSRREAASCECRGDFSCRNGREGGTQALPCDYRALTRQVLSLERQMLEALQFGPLPVDAEEHDPWCDGPQTTKHHRAHGESGQRPPGRHTRGKQAHDDTARHDRTRLHAPRGRAVAVPQQDPEQTRPEHAQTAQAWTDEAPRHTDNPSPPHVPTASAHRGVPPKRKVAGCKDAPRPAVRPPPPQRPEPAPARRVLPRHQPQPCRGETRDQSNQHRGPSKSPLRLRRAARQKQQRRQQQPRRQQPSRQIVRKKAGHQAVHAVHAVQPETHGLGEALYEPWHPGTMLRATVVPISPPRASSAPITRGRDGGAARHGAGSGRTASPRPMARAGRQRRRPRSAQRGREGASEGVRDHRSAGVRTARRSIAMPEQLRQQDKTRPGGEEDEDMPFAPMSYAALRRRWAAVPSRIGSLVYRDRLRFQAERMLDPPSGLSTDSGPDVERSQDRRGIQSGQTREESGTHAPSTYEWRSWQSPGRAVSRSVAPGPAPGPARPRAAQRVPQSAAAPRRHPAPGSHSSGERAAEAAARDDEQRTFVDPMCTRRLMRFFDMDSDASTQSSSVSVVRVIAPPSLYISSWPLWCASRANKCCTVPQQR